MSDDDAGQPTEQPPADVDARLGALEDRADRQEGLLQQILDKLSRAPAPSTRDSGAGAANIAELVRQGVAELEADKQRKQRDDEHDTARRDHAERIAALEEMMPREPAATPAGRMRAWAQVRVFGIDDPLR